MFVKPHEDDRKTDVHEAGETDDNDCQISQIERRLGIKKPN
jgi:hypothetical protein